MLPRYVTKAMRILERAGYEAWLVGGCVRDRLRGEMPHDYDLTTSAPPKEMLRLFEGYRCVLAGLSHGTVTPIIEHHPVEITTFRTETGYRDHRRPDTVAFTDDIREDLARRDFTVNAMAWHPRRGLCDPFGGKADLAARIIRAVGEPERRFEEDALRILRALRFAVRLGFTMEEKTAQAMRKAAPTLTHIAAERITEELRGILGTSDCARLYEPFVSIWQQVLPGVALADAEELAAPLDFVLRLVLLCDRSGRDVTERLCLTKIERRALTRLWAAMDEPVPQDVVGVRRLVAAHGAEDADALLRLWAATGKDTERAGELLCECVERGDCMSLAQLAVTGADLDMPPAQIGVCLRDLLDAVVSERVANEQEALLSYLKHDILKENTQGGC